MWRQGQRPCRVQAEELLIKAMIAGGECQEARQKAASLFANCHAAGLQVRLSHTTCLDLRPPPRPCTVQRPLTVTSPIVQSCAQTIDLLHVSQLSLTTRTPGTIAHASSGDVFTQGSPRISRAAQRGSRG